MKELRCTGIRKDGKLCNRRLFDYSDESDRVYGETRIEIICPKCGEKKTLKLE